MSSDVVEYVKDAAGNPSAVIIPIDLWVKIFPAGASSVENVTEGIEDYCLGKAMDEADKTPLLSREEALAFLEEDTD